MFSTILDIPYENYEVDVDNLCQFRDAAINHLKVAAGVSTTPFQVPGTETQSDSDIWHRERAIRITSSNSKRIASAKTNRQNYNLLKTLLWGKPLPDIKALQYGRQNKDVAFQQYKAEFCGSENNVFKSGLWVNPAMPELCCSPDGVIRDSKNDLKGVIEIKCPFVLEKVNPLHTENLQPSTVRNL